MAPDGGPVAGWYADPTGAHPKRFWDGATWTDQVALADDSVLSEPMPAADAVPAADPSGGAPAAGWYADPHDANQSRWWDGTQWTDHFDASVAPSTAATAGVAAAAASRSKRVKVGAAVAGTLLVGGLLALLVSSGGSSKSSTTAANRSSSSSASVTTATTATTAAPSPSPTAVPQAALSGTYASKIGYPPGCSTAEPVPITGIVKVDPSARTVTFDFHAGTLLVADMDGLAFKLYDPSVHTTYVGSFDTSGPAPTFHLEGTFSDDPCLVQVIDGTKVSG